ncbi:MAG: transcription-repair coupling factor, partial [Pseudomonadota bacterium]|nr:transcription-repair coupling factor [Pseudomonadota bacterium]
EHWLPLFYDKLDSAFDHFGECVYFTDPQTGNAYQERSEQISDYYTAREEAMHDKSGQGGTIKPLPPEHLYLSDEVWQTTLDRITWVTLDGYARPDAQNEDFGARTGKNFAAERGMVGVNVFDSFIAHLSALQNNNKKVLLVCWSTGARDRMTTVLEEHGARDIRQVANWADVAALPTGVCAIADFGLDEGFETDTLAVVSEQDILGDRMVRRQRRKRADNFLTEAASLSVGDHVVHVEHGIGRFEGLQTIDVDGAPHDCLKLVYHADARLFLPVENIELLSRFGGDDMSVTLDKIGGGAWQMRKAKLKEKLNIIAEELIKTAAARAMREGEKLFVGDNLYEEFCARFAFEETEDQLSAIEAVVDDLASGKPMDRLVCGDVGFGKTEVALRAAFIAAISGKQVAIIAPTTLLARQHMQTFTARFKDLPVVVRELSRLVSAKDAAQTRAGLADGEVDIIIGTHALLSKNISFKRLGLVVVDEEQHFGVAHKERLKNLRNEVHVLTLTATPIPRTLQMAMTGVRDLSIIATPPVDRLAVRTYVSPFDAVSLREALLREKYRAGQSFIIVPRISDITEITDFLSEDVPEISFIAAHGQMSGSDLEDRMTAFYQGTYDILVSTSIIESGLDIPSVNTIIIHRADRFGLAQLYQMRGRVGRSKTRAYAYLTYNENNGLTESAEKRLKVMQSLDSLGAGFNLASYDLDLRGAGNLVGEEQSGHIKEVGFELYQTMLEEAVANQQGVETDRSWSPQINAGISVMIPEAYVPDLDLRMGLYRRLANLEDRRAIDAFAVELVDRFGT